MGVVHNLSVIRQCTLFPVIPYSLEGARCGEITLNRRMERESGME
jgi:hypothetical protein